MRAFPIKRSHPGATNKVNVFASEILAVLRKEHAPAYDRLLELAPSICGRVFDDQLSALVLFAAGLIGKVPDPVNLAARMVLDPIGAKQVSTALKSLGANSSLLGAMLVEGDTLQGRGVKPADLLAEARYRTDATAVAAHVADFDPDALRAVVREVLKSEMAEQPIFQTPEELWERRWAWCVNGSHARLLERLKPRSAVPDIPGYDRWYRRMYAESRISEPITGWDGEVIVTASPKLEHGKTRSIFACDSDSYFAFEHLMVGVESVWANRSAVLNPGSGGNVGMASRVRRLRSGGAVSVMLDFDDFNSQHTLEAQKIVLEETVAISGYDATLGANLVKSFDHMRIFLAGQEVGTAKGTLMSGHRCTTFINTVLNAAYIRLACGRALYGEARGLHVGDDVYLSCPSYAVAGRILTAMRASPCRLNPAKQSVGTVGAEFLRLGIRDDHSVGYFCRSVSSVVSGNWVTELAMSEREGLTSIVQGARTLINRARAPHLAKYLVPSCCRMTRMRPSLVRSLLAGEVALDNGPIYVSSGTGRRVILEEENTVSEGIDHSVPSYASNDYLSKAASAVELQALTLTSSSVKSAMIRSSYAKAVSSGTQGIERVTVTAARVFTLVGSTTVEELLKRRVKPGALSGYPIVQLLRGRLRRSELRILLWMVGADGGAADVEREAWGAESMGCYIRGWLPYSDAASLSARTETGVIYSSNPCYA